MPKVPRPLRILVPALLAAFAAAGCESSTLSSGEVQGRYVLVSYNGAPLPGETASLESARYYLLADTIELGPNGIGSESSVTRVDFRNPAVADQEEASVTSFGYERNDDRLRLTYACPPTALCAPGPHAIGQLDGDELVLNTRAAVLRFERVE